MYGEVNAHEHIDTTGTFRDQPLLDRKTPLLRIETFLFTVPIVASCVQFADRLSRFLAAVSTTLQNKC